MVSTVASSAASIASKASTARPCVWVVSRLHTSTSSASRDGRQVTQKSLAESLPGGSTQWLRHVQVLAEAVRDGAAGGVQGSPAGAGGLALHAEDLQIRRRWGDGVRPHDHRMPSGTAPRPHGFPALRHAGVLSGHVPRGLLRHPL